MKVLWLYNTRVLTDVDVTDSQVSLSAIGNVISGNSKTVSNHVRIQNIVRNYGIESRLILQNFTPQDYGLYNCTAYNEFGTAHDQFDIFRRSIIQKIG